LPIKYALDKIFAVDTDYRAESDKAYVIRKAGTDSATKAVVSVAGAPCLEIFEPVAPLTMNKNNLLGPLDLDPLIVVVPPAKVLRFSGAAGSQLRCIGEILELAPGEVLPTNLLARYGERAEKFITYQTGSVTKAAGATWTAGDESDVITVTVPAGEKWMLKRLYMGEARLDDGTPVPRGYSRIYVDDKPYDLLDTAMGPKGICGSGAPHPPRIAFNTTLLTSAMQPFTLAKMPIELKPGKKLRITIINNGADYTVPTGRTLYLIASLVMEKEYLS